MQDSWIPQTDASFYQECSAAQQRCLVLPFCSTRRYCIAKWHSDVVYYEWLKLANEYVSQGNLAFPSLG
jgi:hypothetical protein